MTGTASPPVHNRPGFFLQIYIYCAEIKETELHLAYLLDVVFSLSKLMPVLPLFFRVSKPKTSGALYRKAVHCINL